MGFITERKVDPFGWFSPDENKSSQIYIWSGSQVSQAGWPGFLPYQLAPMVSNSRISSSGSEEAIYRKLKSAWLLVGGKRLVIRRRASFSGPPLLFPTDVEI